MSDDEEDPINLPVVQISRITKVWDAQVSIVDELLGDLSVLTPPSTSELIAAPPEPNRVIHPHRGAEIAQLGWTREQLVASLGDPQSIIDGRLEELDLGEDYHYTDLGLVAEFRGDTIAKLVFHSGTYTGGLVPQKFQPYAGAIEPDLLLSEARESTVIERLGPPSEIDEDDPELAELLDERPTRQLIYPGWTFKTYDDGTLESVCVPTHYVPY